MKDKPQQRLSGESRQMVVTDNRRKKSECLASSEKLPNDSHYSFENEGKDWANIWRNDQIP